MRAHYLGVELVQIRGFPQVGSISTGLSPCFSNFEQTICLVGTLAVGVHW